MAYLLDANTFIQAKNLQYGFDFCPAYWDWLVRNNAAGTVFSIQQVGDELLAGTDELSDWATAPQGNRLRERDLRAPGRPRLALRRRRRRTYDRARALFPADVLAWVQATQPQAWET
jgi:hypothetical protein